MQLSKSYTLQVPQSRGLTEHPVIKHDTNYNCFIVSYVAMPFDLDHIKSLINFQIVSNIRQSFCISVGNTLNGNSIDTSGFFYR